MASPQPGISIVQGPPSPGVPFIRSTLPAPTGLQAVLTLASASIAVTMNPVPAATGYIIQILDPTQKAVATTTTQTTSATVTVGSLTNNATYTVQAMATAAGGVQSAPASLPLLVVPLSAPTLSSVVLSGTSMTIVFGQVAGATQYTVQLLSGGTVQAAATGTASPIVLQLSTAPALGSNYSVQVWASAS